MTARRFRLLLPALVLPVAACRPRPIVVEGCGGPSANDRIQVTQRRFRGGERDGATFVVDFGSSYPSMPRLSDGYITLQSVERPEPQSILHADSLHPGFYVQRNVRPGLYSVAARRLGFRMVRDTVRLEAGWIDSAAYHTFIDILCLTSISTLNPSAELRPLPVRYPDLLRSANVEGVVIVDLALDSLGRYDRQRSKIQYETHGLFSIAVRIAVDSAARAPAIYGNRRSLEVSRDTFAFILRRDSAEACPQARPHWTPACALVQPPPRAIIP